MKRYAGFFTVIVIFLCTLIMVACEQKPTTTPTKPATPAAPAAPTINMQEGLWEITTTVDMPGMPAGMMKPNIFTTCLNRKESVPKGKNETDCTMKDLKTEGNTVTWTVVCKDATSKGRITYAGTSYDGMTETTMKEDGKDTTIKTTMKGKYLGPCQNSFL